MKFHNEMKKSDDIRILLIARQNSLGRLNWLKEERIELLKQLLLLWFKVKASIISWDSNWDCKGRIYSPSLRESEFVEKSFVGLSSEGDACLEGEVWISLIDILYLQINALTPPPLLHPHEYQILLV